MNMKEWVKDNSEPSVDEFGIRDSEWAVVSENDLMKLNETHAIVPRKISRETLLEIQSKQPCTIRKMIELFIEISER